MRRMLLVSSALVMAAGLANGAIVQSTEVVPNPGDQNTWSPGSATDLINAGTTTLQSAAYTGTTALSTSMSHLNDGENWYPDNLNTTTFLANQFGGTLPDTSATYTLDTSVNTAGYNITAVDSYAAWTNGWVGQKYQVSYSTVSDPGTWVPLFTASLASVDADSTHINTLLTDESVATGVKAIKVDFLVPDGYFQGTTYRELDVTGSPTAVPEPATIGLLSLPLVAALRRRRA